MLRTNETFLQYIQILYKKQSRKEYIRLRDVKQGTKLFQQDTPALHVMLIKDGFVKCSLNEENDKEFILEFLGRGEILGELESIKMIPCLCDVEAMCDMKVYVISIPYFQQLLEQDIQFNHLLLKVFAERIVNTASRASFQQLNTIDNSLARLLEMQKKVDLVLSKEEMAAYLGITIRSLNRSLKNLGK
jgi:CRP/FNR family transcriptional regulator, anaerobic regulatory protein